MCPMTSWYLTLCATLINEQIFVNSSGLAKYILVDLKKITEYYENLRSFHLIDWLLLMPSLWV